jgi:drug/metabolite transporter (DMT)-like permease
MVLFGRWAFSDGVTPSTLLLLRFGLAAPLLALLAWRTGAKWPRGRSLGLAVGMGVVFVGNSMLYFLALARAPAASVAVLFFSYPAMVTLAARLLLGERATGRGLVALVALVLAIAGVLLVVGPAGLQLGGGEMLALGAAAIYTGYVLLARAIPETVHPLGVAAVISTVAALLLGAMVWWQGGPAMPASWAGWWGVAGLTLLSTVVALAAFLAAVRYIGPSSAATLSAAEPAVAALLAFVFLGERLSWMALLGLVLIVGCTAVTVGRQSRDAGEPTRQARRPGPAMRGRGAVLRDPAGR